MPNRCTRKKAPWLRNLSSEMVAAIALIISLNSTAFAHKVYIYAWWEGDTVRTESYFGAKKKVKDGLIQVFNLSGQKLLEGRTNEKGMFSFVPGQKTDFSIVVGDGTGHKNECILKAEESSMDSGDEPGSVQTNETEVEALLHRETDVEQIKIIVEQVLDSRLKPIQRELAMLRKEEGPSLNEIIGGIGYIFGLMGLVMYFKYRKK